MLAKNWDQLAVFETSRLSSSLESSHESLMYRWDGVVVRASASQSVDVGFIP